MTKQIGLLIPINEEASINSRYLAYASKFGNVQFISPLDENIHSLDLLIIPGGSDVNPERYDAKPEIFCQKPNIYMEWWDMNILPQYLMNKTPILGICRGFQTISVHFGVKLKQHLYLPVSEPRYKLVETLDFVLNNQVSDRLYNFCKHNSGKNNKYRVNSLHHQGYYPADVEGTPVKVLATSKEYGNVEAATVEGYPIFICQHHPEEVNCEYVNMSVMNLLTPALKYAF